MMKQQTTIVTIYSKALFFTQFVEEKNKQNVQFFKVSKIMYALSANCIVPGCFETLAILKRETFNLAVLKLALVA